jgi:hypothetical protein
MSRLLSILSIACIGSSLAACSVSTRVPFVGAVGSSSPPRALEAPESGDLAANSAGCEQELGSDTGGIVESAALIDFGSVDGCVTDDDRLDGFVVHVEDSMALSVKLKLLDEHGAVHLSAYDVDGEKLGFVSVGSFETKRLRFDVEGETDVFIRVEAFSHGDANHGRYKLIISPDAKVASR